MNKKILGLICGALGALMMTASLNVNSAEAIDPPGGTFYDFNLCFSPEGVQSGCLLPSLNGPCSLIRACHNNPNH